MAKPESIIISTGGISRDHTIQSILFAVGLQKFGGKGIFKKGVAFIKDSEYNEMIDQVYISALATLREKASKIGADAVIHCKFDIEQITLTEKGFMSEGEALRIQVFVTGTAVKYT